MFQADVVSLIISVVEGQNVGAHGIVDIQVILGLLAIPMNNRRLPGKKPINEYGNDVLAGNGLTRPKILA